MRIEEQIGRRVRDRLAELKMTHREFGERMGRYLGKPWSRSAVSVALKGDRAWTASEILAAAAILMVTPGNLLSPQDDLEPIEFPSGETLTRDELASIYGPERLALNSLAAHLGQVAAGTQSSLATLNEIQQLLDAGGRLTIAFGFDDKGPEYETEGGGAVRGDTPDEAP